MAIPKWTGAIVGKMHNHSVTNIELANKLNIDKNYVSMILNGKKTPKGAKKRFENALNEIIAEKEGK